MCIGLFTARIDASVYFDTATVNFYMPGVTAGQNIQVYQYDYTNGQWTARSYCASPPADELSPPEDELPPTGRFGSSARYSSSVMPIDARYSKKAQYS